MTPAWHELGEWAALILGSLGITEGRVNRLRALLRMRPCCCEYLRKWLNEVGERFWSWCGQDSYWSARSRFWWVAVSACQGGLVEELALLEELRQQVTGLSLAGFRRWISRVEDESSLSHLDVFHKMDGRIVKTRRYGLRAKECP